MRLTTTRIVSSPLVRVKAYTCSSSAASRFHSPVATGEWNLLAADDEQVYAFTRTSGDDTILVVVNLTDRSAGLPGEVAELLGDGVAESQILLSTYDVAHGVKSIARGELARWEGVVIQL